MRWWAIKDKTGKIIPGYCAYHWRACWDKFILANKDYGETLQGTEKRLEKAGCEFVEIEVREIKARN